MKSQLSANISLFLCPLSFFILFFIFFRNETNTPTNIRRLSMALLPVAADAKPQISFYDAGVGTRFTSPVDLLLGGAFGRGIDENIIQLYSFLALNYNPGDEVYMFGYSRGAYTVRSLIGLINIAGLVKRNHIGFVDEAYAMYQRKPGVDSEEAVKFRMEHGQTIPIKCLVCFDTVGALGIPGIFPALFQKELINKYQFHDTRLSKNVEHAVHAVSIEEWKGGKFFF